MGEETVGEERGLLDRPGALKVVQGPDVAPFDVWSLVEPETLDHL